MLSKKEKKNNIKSGVDMANEPIVTDETTLKTEEEFNAEIDRLRMIAEADNEGPVGAPIMPGKFKAKDSTIQKGKELTPEQIELQTQRVRIFQSYANKSILMGKVVSVGKEFMRFEGEKTGRLRFHVVVMYGKFQVFIPVEQFTETSMESILEIHQKNNSDYTLEQVTERYLTARLNAIVPFVVTKALPSEDVENGLRVVGSRVNAMVRMRVRYWYGKTMDGGDYYRNVDDYVFALPKEIADQKDRTTFEPYSKCARVITVTRSGIRIELDGVETFIPVKDLSWNLVSDVHTLYKVGDTVDIVIKTIDRKADNPSASDNLVDFTASVKEVKGDPRRRYISMFTANTLESGVISFIRMPDALHPNVTPKVFVRMDRTNREMQCMCPFPNGEVPPAIGMRAVVRITNVNTERAQLYGNIYHMGE